MYSSTSASTLNCQICQSFKQYTNKQRDLSSTVFERFKKLTSQVQLEREEIEKRHLTRINMQTKELRGE